MRSTRLLLAAALAVGVSVPALAQNEDPRERREELRHRIEERFTERAKEQLGLDAQQVTRLRETSRRFGGRRRELESRERAIRDAMAEQLRPGVAADRDSVAKLTDAAAELRVAYAQTFRDELRETAGFLDAVHRAQLFIMRDRLLRRAREIHGDRWRHDTHRYRRRVPASDSGHR